MNGARPLQKPVLLPDWLWVVLFVLAIAGSILTQTVWFVAGLAAVILAQGIYLFGLARCPACFGKFSFHRGRLPGPSTRYPLQLECKHCHTVWDTGRIRDDDVFFNS
jgi:hypothetical protein